MNINWFTFFAQIVNFVILLALLRRFLYGPVLNVMAEREAQIAARFQEANELAAQGQAAAEAYRTERAELDAQRTALLDEARIEAQAHRTALIEDARSEVDGLQRSWMAAVQQEKERFLQEVRARLGVAVYRVARDALADLANADLEAEIAGNFLARLDNHVQDTTRRDLHHGAPADVIIVRSAFDLPPSTQNAIRRVLTDTTAPNDPTTDGAKSSESTQTSVAFMQEPDLICGIEAQFSSRRVAWCIRDYLESYVEELDAALLADVSTRSSQIEPEVEDAAAGGILPA